MIILLLADEASQFHQSQIQCYKGKRVRDKTVVSFHFRIFAFMKRIWTGAENELPDTLRNEIR